MQREKFEEVLEKCKNSIIDVGIKLGYFKQEDKLYLEEKLREILNNGIDLDIKGAAVYGYYDSKEKKLHYNPHVYKDEQEAMIYILHEMKHSLDQYPDRIGFQQLSNNFMVGANEGATQRFAIDMTEELLGRKIPQTMQKSLGVYLTTNLDEYQIEDKMNELLCNALGITKKEFISAQNEVNLKTMITWISKFQDKGRSDRGNSFIEFQKALDRIYYIRQTTFLSKDGKELEEPRELTKEEIEEVKKQIRICQTEIRNYLKNTNPERLEEIEGEMLMIDEEQIMSDQEMVYQEDYMRFQEFISRTLEVGKYKIVKHFSDGYTYEIDTGEGYITTKDIFKKNPNEVFSGKVYVREGEQYKIIKYKYGKDGVVEQLDPEDVLPTDIIKDGSFINDRETLGNGDEIARLYQVCGRDSLASEIQRKFEYFMNNRNNIEKIIKRFSEIISFSPINEELLAIAEKLANGEEVEFGCNFDFINEDDFAEVAEETPIQGIVDIQEAIDGVKNNMGKNKEGEKSPNDK